MERELRYAKIGLKEGRSSDQDVGDDTGSSISVSSSESMERRIHVDSVTDLLSTLQELEHLDVGFVSLTEALDLTTPSGRAMAGLLAVFAEFEREILRERVRAGLAHARQNGKRLSARHRRLARGSDP